MLFERHFGNELREFTRAQGPAFSWPALDMQQELGYLPVAAQRGALGAGARPGNSCGQRKTAEAEEMHSRLFQISLESGHIKNAKAVV